MLTISIKLNRARSSVGQRHHLRHWETYEARAGKPDLHGIAISRNLRHLHYNFLRFYTDRSNAAQHLNYLFLVIRESVRIELPFDSWVSRLLLLILVENPFER
jgi:hypothetical protein